MRIPVTGRNAEDLPTGGVIPAQHPTRSSTLTPEEPVLALQTCPLPPRNLHQSVIRICARRHGDPHLDVTSLVNSRRLCTKLSPILHQTVTGGRPVDRPDGLPQRQRESTRHRRPEPDVASDCVWAKCVDPPEVVLDDRWPDRVCLIRPQIRHTCPGRGLPPWNRCPVSLELLQSHLSRAAAAPLRTGVPRTRHPPHPHLCRRQEVCGDRVGLGVQELLPRRPLRRGAGSIPASWRICQTVDFAILCPSLIGSPVIRSCPPWWIVVCHPQDQSLDRRPG